MANDQTPSGDAAPPDDPIPRIESFFVEKGARSACPICANPTWVFLDSPDAITMLPHRGKMPIQNGTRGHDLFAFVCRNCGYVRLHLRAVVNREVDLRFIDPDPPEEEGGDVGEEKA